jgi:hypothetical protein
MRRVRVVAHLRKGETDAGLATGFDIGTTTVFRYVRGSQRRRPAAPETGQRQRLSRNQKAVNSAHARQRGPGEQANAQFKSWKILRKIRCCPHRVTDLVTAVLVQAS